eukprot:1215775-Rhodomonas_salina.2
MAVRTVWWPRMPHVEAQTSRGPTRLLSTQTACGRMCDVSAQRLAAFTERDAVSASAQSLVQSYMQRRARHTLTVALQTSEHPTPRQYNASCSVKIGLLTAVLEGSGWGGWACVPTRSSRECATARICARESRQRDQQQQATALTHAPGTTAAAAAAATTTTPNMAPSPPTPPIITETCSQHTNNHQSNKTSHTPSPAKPKSQQQATTQNNTKTRTRGCEGAAPEQRASGSC